MSPWTRCRRGPRGVGTSWGPGGYRVGIAGGYTGWVSGGLYRYPPSPYHAAKPTADQRPQGAGPRSAGVGRMQVGAPKDSVRRRGRSQVPPTPATPGGFRGPLRCTWDLADCRLWAIRARFDLILLKVSQNGRVSPKYVKKACHSPYFTKRVRKVTS